MEERDIPAVVKFAALLIIGLCLLWFLHAPALPVQIVTTVEVPTLMPTATPPLTVPTVAVAQPQVSIDDHSIVIVNNQTVIYQDDHSYTCVALVCP